MNNNLEILKKVTLFEGINENLSAMLECLGSDQKKYARGEIILLTGQPVTAVGVILSGEVQIIHEDFYGNRSILTELNPSHIFGESFASAGIPESPVTVIAKTNATILFLGIDRIITTCPNSCIFHNHLIENLLKILARKNILLSSKNQLLSLRTIEDKILSYLSLQAEKKGNLEFEIPFSRNELADFLCVDRSALSRVLSKLKKEAVNRIQK